MRTNTLVIDSNVRLEAQIYDGDYPTDVYLSYVEHSPDPGYSDSETDVAITKEKAIEIIAFLTKEFKLER